MPTAPDPDAKPIEDRLRRNLKARREARHMSQEALAERLSAQGVPTVQQTIARIETGTRSLRIDEAAHIALALETTLDEMMRPPVPTSAKEQRAELRKRRDKIRELNDRRNEVAYKLTEALERVEALEAEEGQINLSLIVQRASVEALEHSLQEHRKAAKRKEG